MLAGQALPDNNDLKVLPLLLQYRAECFDSGSLVVEAWSEIFFLHRVFRHIFSPFTCYSPNILLLVGSLVFVP